MSIEEVLAEHRPADIGGWGWSCGCGWFHPDLTDPDCFPEDATVRHRAHVAEKVRECYVQVGWFGPYGIIPGGMDNDPAPHWRPLLVEAT